MSRISACLIGISLLCLQLACSTETVDVPLALEEFGEMTEDPDLSPQNVESPGSAPQDTAPQDTDSQDTDSQDTDSQDTDSQDTDSSAVVPQDTVPQDTVPQDTVPQDTVPQDAAPKPVPSKLSMATFGSGCFWCTEAVFLRLKGVTAVESGYSGGFVENPTYEDVSAGTTGHAEVCRISYDSDKISFDELLKVFWLTHDPTTLNQQGADRGTQYRSVVFFHDETQRKLAEEYKQKLDKSGAFPGPIVTEITPLKDYYKAEAYHQNYYEQNPYQGYCQAVVRPKVKKFEAVFKELLKTEP